MSMRKRKPKEFDYSGVPFGEPLKKRSKYVAFPLALAKFAVVSVLVGVFAAGLIAPFVIVPAMAAKTAIGKWEALPTELPFDEALPQRILMTDRNGKVITTFYTENRLPVKLEQINPYVVDALLATEDSRFYEHRGMDPKGVARAMLNNSSGGSTQGASTITQQYVKNILLYAAANEDERAKVTASSIDRKLREARYALALENTLTKDQILEGYLNTVYFGDGAYGIGAAAQHYFNKNVADLNLVESATLVGILKSTTNYDPTNNMENSIIRRNVVLDRMAATGKITKVQAEVAKKAPITLNLVNKRNGCVVSKYPLYCQWVKESLLASTAFGETPEDREARWEKGGFTITTALDPEIQDLATKEAVDALGKKNRVAAGIAVMQPGTGEVLALATNKPFGQDAKKGETELLLPVLPSYQPGSNFKPIVLAAALEQGVPITTTFDTPNNYKPQNMRHPDDGFSNDDDSGHGVIDAYRATADSVNTWFVQLIEKTGVKNVADFAERVGVTSLPRSGPMKITNKDAALALGAYETSPLQIATAYSTFAAHGIKCNPVGILNMVTAAGKPMDIPDPDCHQAISPEVADTVADVLTQPFKDGTASGLRLDDSRPSAGKTGTTDNSAATWFTGFTPQYVTSIWIGDPRGGQKYPLKNVRAFGTTYGTVYGSYIAGPIWRNIMNPLHEGLPIEEFAKPGTITEAKPIVPNVVGLSLPAAISTLQSSGYKVAIAPETAKETEFSTPGQVMSQSPDGGAQYGTGSEIVLTLSYGSDTNIEVGE